MKDFINSLKNNNEGFSGRKLTAFTLTACIVALHILFIWKPQFELFISLVITDLVGIGFFLGLVTIANIIDLKNGNVVKTTTTTETVEVKKDSDEI